MRDYNSEFRKAFGSITLFLEKYCGYRVVRRGGVGEQSSLWCPHHADTDNNRKGMNCHSNDDKDVWYCYTCKNEGAHIASGSYVQAIMEARNMSKEEAFEWCCNEAGIKRGKTNGYDPVSVRRMFVQECHRRLMENYSTEGSDYHLATEYITKRGFIGKTVTKYAMGYSNSSELDALKSKGITTEDLIRADILRKSKKNGRLYNAFRGRVVMMCGNNIYGRAISDDKVLKHLYTSSGNLIFNAVSAEKQKRDKLFIVESIYDALSIEQFIDRLGLNATCVGTLGTQGIKLDKLVAWVKKVNPVEVIIIPDSDPWFNQKNLGRRHMAGQKAGLKKAKALMQEGISVRLMPLKTGMDPNDLSKVMPDGTRVGAKDFLEMINKAMPVLQFEIFCEAHYYKFSCLGAKDAFLAKVRDIVLSNNIRLSSEIVRYISAIIHTEEDEVRDYFSNTLLMRSTMDYFQKCYAGGYSDQQILDHIHKFMEIAKKRNEHN